MARSVPILPAPASPLPGPAHSRLLGAPVSEPATLPAPTDSAARAPWRDDKGQGLSEYALLVGAVAVLLVSCAMLFRTELSVAVNLVGSHVGSQAANLDGGGGNGGGNGGSSSEAPGHGNTPPGQGGTPPGQGGTPPGKGGKK